jgi:hypothetical protein
MKKFLTILATLVVIVGIAFKTYEYKFYLNHIPKDLGVWHILYTEDESWEFGPGGNETGIIVYELPESVARDIRGQGIKYLEQIREHEKPRKPRNWHGRYERWLTTPIKITKPWTDHGFQETLRKFDRTSPSIANYLGAYGFGIPIKSEIENMVNDAIRKPGNFYSYGRIGVIIVVPSIQKVIYAWNG